MYKTAVTRPSKIVMIGGSRRRGMRFFSRVRKRIKGAAYYQNDPQLKTEIECSFNCF